MLLLEKKTTTKTTTKNNFKYNCNFLLKRFQIHNIYISFPPTCSSSPQSPTSLHIQTSAAHHVDLFVVKNATTNEIRDPERVVQDGWFQVLHILFPLPSARRPDQHLSAAERERNCAHYDALIAAHNNVGR